MAPYNQELHYLRLFDAGPSSCSLVEVYQLDQELLQLSSVQMLHSGVLFVTVVRFLLFSLSFAYDCMSDIFFLRLFSSQFFQRIRQLGSEANSRLQFCVGYDFCFHSIDGGSVSDTKNRFVFIHNFRMINRKENVN